VDYVSGNTVFSVILRASLLKKRYRNTAKVRWTDIFYV
jgi:hypothetical protein